jgi:uncharacterized membrane protein
MKTAYVRSMTLILLALQGCNSAFDGQPAGRADFMLHGPAPATAIMQGEVRRVRIHLDRGRDFRENVHLKVDPPTGVEAVFSDSMIAPSESGDIQLKIGVGDSASPGEQTVHVTGTSESGSVVTLAVQIVVIERPDLVKIALKGPLCIPSIKPGEKQIVPITVERSSRYLAGVKLQVHPENGMEAELTAASIRLSETDEVGLVITPQKTATIGAHTVRITGTADGATVIPVEVKVNVVARQ